MKKTMLLVCAILLVLIPAVFSAGTKEAEGKGEVYTLTVQSHDPETSATGQFLNEWASRLDKASSGRIKLNIQHGGVMGSPRDTLSLIENGTADIGFGLSSYFAGTFKNSEAISFPLIDLPDASMASKVYWHLYKDFDFLKDEYKDFHVLLLFANCQSPITTVKTKISSLDQFNGMNVRVNSGPPTTFIQKLGASPKPMPITEVNTSLQTGAIDGVITDWHAIKNFQLFEPAKYYANENLGVSGYFLLMNKDSYGRLPGDLQKILDDNSGEACLAYSGQYWIDAEKDAMASVKADGDEIYQVPAAVRAGLEAAAKATITEWAAARENGQGIIDAIDSLIEKYN
jgi:TRAP-type C4-dicarboxylate transport system substrate-binding protein